MKIGSKPTSVKKRNRKVTLSKKNILLFLFTASGFRPVVLCPNLITMRAKRRYQFVNELEQLKHSSSMKNDEANKVTMKYGKQCNHWKKRKTSQTKHSYLASVTHILVTFNFFVVKLNLIRKHEKQQVLLCSGC